jgi:hypothetical protein
MFILKPTPHGMNTTFNWPQNNLALMDQSRAHWTGIFTFVKISIGSILDCGFGPPARRDCGFMVSLCSIIQVKSGKMPKNCQQGLTRFFNWYMDFFLVQSIEY